MDVVLDFITLFLQGLQKPTLGFLLGGMLLAAMGSKLDIPDAIYRFIVFVLLMRIGLKAGMEISDAELDALLLPAVLTMVAGCSIVLLGRYTLALLPSINRVDGIATAGLFGAVSSSTLAAAMMHLDDYAMPYEAWVAALYPFMDIPALLLAIILGKAAQGKANATLHLRPLLLEALRGSALSALLLGLFLGLFTKSETVFASFYDPLFYGLLSILMLIMGMEAYTRFAELRRVAHWYIIYSILAPIVHGLIGFGLGYIAHITTGFSPGGVIILAVMAASSSDISGPPTLRAALPSANPSAYIGSSTSIGTPVAIAICIPLFIELARVVFPT